MNKLTKISQSLTALFGDFPPIVDLTRIAVVTAGSSDIPVAGEAIRTLRFHNMAATPFFDVGVAGLWRLQERLEEIADHSVVIVVAGMDGALVSVLGGLIGSVIIATPTSTGYGAAQNGQTALNAALTSCAPGIVVTNIDNGYGAACAAIRALNLSQQHGGKQQ